MTYRLYVIICLNNQTIKMHVNLFTDWNAKKFSAITTFVSVSEIVGNSRELVRITLVSNVGRSKFTRGISP